MRTPSTVAALVLLEGRASVTWPFEQFRRALVGYGGPDETRAAKEGRWQVVNASLNAVRRVSGLAARASRESAPVGALGVRGLADETSWTSRHCGWAS